MKKENISNGLKFIGDAFIGDIEGYYSYKSGSKIVDFFNTYFKSKDKYGSGFPSRWRFVHEKLIVLYNAKLFNKYLNIILSKNYLMIDLGLNEVEAIEKSNENVNKINNEITKYKLRIVKRDEKFYMILDDEDLVPVGSGGFADVYLSKSTGKIVKKLKDDFIIQKSIKSRFKREFNITKSLSDVPGIINVYDFDENKCLYTMKKAEQTLYQYVSNSDLPYELKKKCITQIVEIMKIVHSRNIVHRDLSPSNIFIDSGRTIIADFGLGKDLNMFNSHQTIYTNTLGQYFYCAPEQFMMLREGDHKSDIYSLGRVINFIQTGDPRCYNHFLRSVCEKASSEDRSVRYDSIDEMNINILKSFDYYEKGTNKERVMNSIRLGILDDDVEQFIYDLNGKQICKYLLEEKLFIVVLSQFVQKSEKAAKDIMSLIETSYKESCLRWEDWDIIADFSEFIISGNFPFVVKEKSARILYYISNSVNRFNVQSKVKKIIDFGVDPLLEEILLGDD